MRSIKKSFIVSSLSSDETKRFESHREVTDFLLSSSNEYMVVPAYHSVDSTESKFRVSIVMPVWQAPMRTLRAIMSVINQDTNGWQLIALGDGCPNFQSLITSDFFAEKISEAYINGNEIIAINTEHFGGYGYHQREMAKSLATGEFVIYLDNDDVLKANHISTRLGAVGKSEEDIDLYYFNTWREDINWHREAMLEFGHIGHSEIMWKTSFLKTLPPIDANYGHDWTQINHGLQKGAKYKKVVGEPTYIIKSTPTKREKDID